jgi:hypothetical protein
MSTNSSKSYTMKALLAGAALAGLVATTTSAQASVAGASTSVSTEAAGDVASDVWITGAKRRYCHRHHRHHRHCHHHHRRIIIIIR